MRALLKALWLIAGIICFAVYQNCAKPEFRGDALQASSAKHGGGDNYDGKIFAYTDPAQLCSDGRSAFARIKRESQQYFLIRDNCANLPQPVLLADSEITVDVISDGYVIYRAQRFIDENSFVPVLVASPTPTPSATPFGEVGPSPSPTPPPRPARTCSAFYPAYNGPTENTEQCDEMGYELKTVPSTGTNPSGTELYVVAIYESGELGAPVTIHIPPGSSRITIVLSAYHGTRWRFTGDVGRVQSAIVRGYECQGVEGIDPAVVNVRDRDTDGTYAGMIYIEEPKYSAALNRIQSDTRLKLTKAVSMYSASCMNNAFTAAP